MERQPQLRGGKNQNRHCFYPGCRSGYSDIPEKVSKFGTPRDKDLFEQWKKIVPRADRVLQEHDCICEKHFKKEDIIREWTSGGVITIPLKNPRLRPGALPSPELSDLSLIKTRQIKKPKRIIIKKDSPPKKKMKINEENLETATIAVENETINTSTKTPETTETTETPETTETTETPETTETSETPETTERPETPMEVVLVFANPFDEIVDKINSIKLPTGWGVHILPEYILLTECQIIHSSEPVTLRQILIDKTLAYKLYYSKTPVTTVESLNDLHILDIEDIEKLLDLFVKTYFCVGGPRTKFFPPSDINTKTGHPDLLGVWRHIMCSTVVSRPSSACIYCSSLHGKFAKSKINKEKPVVDNRSINRLKTENSNLKIQIRNLKKELDNLLNSQPTVTLNNEV